MKEAYLYKKEGDDRVRCLLCNHRCLIKNGKRGLCGVRENISGRLVTLVYDKIITTQCDPIEKKPLFHFLPGSISYSIATVGCNFKCAFCQNADISQMPFDHNRIIGSTLSPEKIVKDALDRGSSTISYTYTEPTIYFELALDTARAAVSNGLKNVFVSNGYMSEECIREICPDLHAANVDLKSFSDDFYREYCGARIKPVLKTLENMKKMGIWLEVTTLLIPGLNDSTQELKELASFLYNLDPTVPWHISRFHPTYRLTNVRSTPPERIQVAREIGFEAGLKYVYSGNLPGDEGEKTFCHNCGKLLINRYGFYVTDNNIEGNRCSGCHAKIPGVWE